MSVGERSKRKGGCPKYSTPWKCHTREEKTSGVLRVSKVVISALRKPEL